MKIIILGAGQVGSTLAEHLVKENNDITIIDKSADCIHRLEESLDIRTIIGNAAYPNILVRAGAEDADMLIAVTNSDETNMVACQVAHTLFQIPTKIARIRSLQYLAYDSLFDITAIPIDVIISPEQLVTNHLRKLIEHPNALQVFDFANKKVQLTLVRAFKGGAIVGHRVRKLKYDLPNIEAKIIAIFRRNTPIIPDEDTRIEEDDEIFFISATENTKKVMSELHSEQMPNKKIIIAGGGNIGARLAIALESEYNIKIIERNIKKVELLASQLKHATVLHGDITDRELLFNEDTGSADIFCAVTNTDEANIMASLMAKKIGAKKAITLINKIPYIEVVKDTPIDGTIFPQQSTVGSLLAHVRQGDVVKVHSLRRGKAEALEAIAHGNKHNSKVIGKRPEEIDMPEGAVIAAVVRKNEVIINIKDVAIMPGDHIIIFLTNKKMVPFIEKLFHIEKLMF